MILTFVKLATFIPWIIYFIEIMLYRIGIIESKDCNRDKYFNYLNKNLFKSINITELILFCIFIIFMQYGKTLVLEILFPACYVYLIIDFFHTLASGCKKIKNKWLMVESIILVVVLVGYFLIFNHLYMTYSAMFTVSLLSSFIIYIFAFLYKCIKNIFKK